MSTEKRDQGDRFGAEDLRLPADLRSPLSAHLNDLRERYKQRGWAGRVGFGQKPALLVIDLAKFWLDPQQQIGSRLDSIVENVCRLLAAARAHKVPIFFTTYQHDLVVPTCPHDRKLVLNLPPAPAELFALDPRLQRQPHETLVRKPYASAFKSTNLHTMLAALGVDTLIVTGISTSHCIYASCRDATDSFRVIIPREAVGERCELMHEVFLLDLDIDLGDVVPVQDVLQYLEKFPCPA